MAVTDIYNSLTFGGVNSLDYGVYISGPAVFGAPTRAVTFVDVPGRNGAIEIDGGHWNNIEVTYKAGVFGAEQSEFASKINAFRNAIVSQIGYKRLTDTYNPDEYRLGIYESGISVEPVNTNKAGEFDLVFNCKPQRYLLSGENEITVASGDVITNPTLYESGPLIKLQGYGEVQIGDYTIKKKLAPVGEVDVAPGYSSYSAPATIGNKSKNSFQITYDLSKLGGNQTNFITLQGWSMEFSINSSRYGIVRGSIEPGDIQILKPIAHFNPWQTIDEWRTEWLAGGGYAVDWVDPNKMDYEMEFTVEAEIRDGGHPEMIINYSVILNSCTDSNATIEAAFRAEKTTGYSYVESLGEIIIDSETGISYMETENGKVFTDNFLVLPSELVELKQGPNTITYDSNINYLKITPRWWEL